MPIPFLAQAAATAAIQGGGPAAEGGAFGGGGLSLSDPNESASGDVSQSFGGFNLPGASTGGDAPAWVWPVALGAVALGAFILMRR